MLKAQNSMGGVSGGVIFSRSKVILFSRSVISYVIYLKLSVPLLMDTPSRGHLHIVDNFLGTNQTPVILTVLFMNLHRPEPLYSRQFNSSEHVQNRRGSSVNSSGRICKNNHLSKWGSQLGTTGLI